MEAEVLADVYISCAPADQPWVDGELLPRLDKAGITYVIDRPIGLTHVEASEQLITTSRKTILVLSPAWLEDPILRHDGQLVQTWGLLERKRLLLPIMVAACELPLYLQALSAATFYGEGRTEREFARLIAAVEEVIPTPLPADRRDIDAWRIWLRRHRRQIRRGTAVFFVGWLLLAHAIGLPPLRDTTVWQSAGVIPGGHTMHRQEQTLLVGAFNTQPGCPPQGLGAPGIWWQTTPPAGEWAVAEIDSSLCIPDWPGQAALSDIRQFAQLPGDSAALYALTSHSGILVSRDGGRHFANAGLPDLTLQHPTNATNGAAHFAVTGAASEPDFWVTRQESGLFWLEHGAEQWTRVGPVWCDAVDELNGTSLRAAGPETVLVGTIKQGLWHIDATERRCERVFDGQGEFEIYDIEYLDGTNGGMFTLLIVAKSTVVNREDRPWKLFHLCGLPEQCRELPWATPVPLFETTTAIVDLAIGRASGPVQWVLIDGLGAVRQGDLDPTTPFDRLPRLTRCIVGGCSAGRFVPERLDTGERAAGEAPLYLLVHAEISNKGHVYYYTQDKWWRRWWP